METRRTVHVLGCGPAGLMSAHAAIMLGYDVVVHSKKRKSEMFGAQYLHRPIPGISTDDHRFEIDYVLQGSEEDYRKKVYGPNWDGSVSPEDLVGSHDGWDIRAAYDILWKQYANLIVEQEFKGPEDVRKLIDEHSVMDMWASTIPARVLCASPQMHAFSAQDVWAIGDAPERGVFCPVQVADETVVCNGESAPGWYRASRILGYGTAEWAGEHKPPIEGVSKVVKPLATTCDCFPEIHRLGRYGKWTKGVLSHEAFFDTWHGLGGTDQEL